MTVRSGRAANRLIMVAALLMSCRFLWPLRANFTADWYNNKWAVGYFGEYFRHHLWLPAEMNTSEWGGFAAPIFYGNLGYPIIGVFSSILAPGLVLRIASLLLYAAQYLGIFKALRRLEAPSWSAHTVSCLVIWSTYPLTNLFNRGAFLEFMATSLLVCALSLAVLLLYAPSPELERRYAGRLLLCLTVSAGAHPITAIFGIPFFTVIGLIFWNSMRQSPGRIRSVLRALAPGVLGAMACLSAWLYAVAKYSNTVSIRHIVPTVNFYPDSWDSWVTRFYPIPMDGRVVPGVALSDIWVPYLDTQANVPLLILFLALSATAILRCWKSGQLYSLAGAVGVPAGLFVFFTWISLSPTSYDHLPPILTMIQFAYRAVTYQNLSLLLGVFLLFRELQNSKISIGAHIANQQAMRWIAAGCMLLALYGVTIKWGHIRASRDNVGVGTSFVLPGKDERRDWIHLPVTYYGILDYTTPDLFVPLTADESEEARNAVPAMFRFDSSADFGVAQPLEIQQAKASWVRTNIQIFPWNRIAVDGQSLSPADVRSYDMQAIAIHVPAGRHHLEFQFEPDRAWVILRAISLLTLFGWVLLEACLAGVQRRRGG